MRYVKAAPAIGAAGVTVKVGIASGSVEKGFPNNGATIDSGPYTRLKR